MVPPNQSLMQGLDIPLLADQAVDMSGSRVSPLEVPNRHHLAQLYSDLAPGMPCAPHEISQAQVQVNSHTGNANYIPFHSPPPTPRPRYAIVYHPVPPTMDHNVCNSSENPIDSNGLNKSGRPSYTVNRFSHHYSSLKPTQYVWTRVACAVAMLERLIKLGLKNTKSFETLARRRLLNKISNESHQVGSTELDTELDFTNQLLLNSACKSKAEIPCLWDEESEYDNTANENKNDPAVSGI